MEEIMIKVPHIFSIITALFFSLLSLKDRYRSPLRVWDNQKEGFHPVYLNRKRKRERERDLSAESVFLLDMTSKDGEKMAKNDDRDADEDYLDEGTRLLMETWKPFYSVLS